MIKTIKRLNEYLHRNQLLLVFILLIIGIFIRILNIDYNPIGLDEPFSIFHAQMKLKEIVGALKGGNNPPLYELLLHFWIKIFGISPASVRFPSFIFSVLNVYFVYKIADKFFNRKVAILSTLLIIFSSYHIYFSHEARVYSLLALLTTISFYIVVLINFKESKIAYYVWLCITYVFLIYSHYLGVFVICLEVLIMLFYNYKNLHILKKLSILVLAILLSFSVYIPEFLNRFLDSAQHGTWLSPVDNLGNLHHIIYVFANENRFVYLFIILIFWFAAWRMIYKLKFNAFIKNALLLIIIPLFFITSYSIFFKIPFLWRITSMKLYIVFFIFSIVVGLIIVVYKKRKTDLAGSTIFMWFILPLFLFFAVSFYFPIFLARYLIFIIPAFYLSLAIIIEKNFKGAAFYIVSGVLVCAIIFTENMIENDKKGLVKTVDKVKMLKANSTKIIICPYQFKETFLYHYDKNLFKDYAHINQNLHNINIYPVYKSSELVNIIKPKDSLILFLDAHSKFLYPNNAVLDSLKNHFYIDSRYEYKDSLVLYRLERK